MGVAAILLAVGTPSFVTVVKNSQMSNDYNRLVGSLYLARSEAVKSNLPVTVCPRASNTQCGTDWSMGWHAFVDADTSDDVVALDGTVTAVISGADEIVDTQLDIHDQNTISNYGSTNRTALTATARHFIRYRTQGEADWANGSFILCDERGAAHSRSINVAVTGAVQRGQLSVNDIPMDVFSQEITCP